MIFGQFLPQEGEMPCPRGERRHKNQPIGYTHIPNVHPLRLCVSRMKRTSRVRNLSTLWDESWDTLGRQVRIFYKIEILT